MTRHMPGAHLLTCSFSPPQLWQCPGDRKGAMLYSGPSPTWLKPQMEVLPTPLFLL